MIWLNGELCMRKSQGMQIRFITLFMKEKTGKNRGSNQRSHVHNASGLSTTSQPLQNIF